MLIVWQSLSKDVCDLVVGAIVYHFNCSISYQASDEMAASVDIFCTTVHGGILSDGDC